jgi:type IV pilus assembly protein PilZ
VYEEEVTEKRQHPRKAIQLPVFYRDSAGAEVEGTCSDLSIGGAFVETTTPLPFGAKTTLHLQLPGLETRIQVEATVRWTKPSGMGLQLGLMGARETHALVALLSR